MKKVFEGFFLLSTKPVAVSAMLAANIRAIFIPSVRYGKRSFAKVISAMKTRRLASAPIRILPIQDSVLMLFAGLCC